MKKKELKELCLKVMKENPLAVKNYKAGNTQTLFFLVGAVIKEGDESVLPASVGDMIQELLEKESVVGKKE